MLFLGVALSGVALAVSPHPDGISPVRASPPASLGSGSLSHPSASTDLLSASASVVISHVGAVLSSVKSLDRRAPPLVEAPPRPRTERPLRDSFGAPRPRLVGRVSKPPRPARAPREPDKSVFVPVDEGSLTFDLERSDFLFFTSPH